jgi:NSS family neurotransmitter:Na+ symporter
MSFVGLVAGLIYVTKGGLDWIGTIDGFINGTWGIAFLGLLECVVIGWLYRVENLRLHANERSDWYLGKWWNYSIRIFIPLVLGTLFVWSLIDDFTNEAGFIKTADGQWNVYNCVGLCVVAIAPVIAILASLFKTPSRGETSGVQRELNYPPARTTTTGGWVAIVLSGVAALFMIYAVFAERSAVSFERPLMVLAFAMSVAGLIIANSSMIGCDWIASRPSRLAGVAGIMSTFNISTFFAMVLSAMSPDKVDDTARKLEKLSGVSYAIIAVVVLIVFGGLGWCFYRAIAAGGDED